MQQINLKEIFRSRGVKIPGFVTSMLARLIHQRELNEILRHGDGCRGTAFADSVYDYLDLTIEAQGLDTLPPGRYVFASNHPLGGLDGIGLVKILGTKYGDENIRVLVNDMLMNVEPFRDVFLPVNKYGSQGREAARAIADAYASDCQIVMFPAGLVSRLHPDGEIRDLEWQKSFVAKALESGRQIVPVRFEGLNRRRFYRLAKWRRKLGVKFNIEQVFLPAEVMAARGKHFRVIFSPPVSPLDLRSNGLTPAQIADKLRTQTNRTH